jgi:ornithine cyclodeaminase/alanine dehydrogenase-like protein (mu-crystallin family)
LTRSDVDRAVEVDGAVDLLSEGFRAEAAVPALRGVVCLYDLATGELLALADSASVTACTPPSVCRGRT